MADLKRPKLKGTDPESTSPVINTIEEMHKVGPAIKEGGGKIGNLMLAYLGSKFNEGCDSIWTTTEGIAEEIGNGWRSFLEGIGYPNAREHAERIYWGAGSIVNRTYIAMGTGLIATYNLVSSLKANHDIGDLVDRYKQTLHGFTGNASAYVPAELTRKALEDSLNYVWSALDGNSEHEVEMLNQLAGSPAALRDQLLNAMETTPSDGLYAPETFVKGLRELPLDKFQELLGQITDNVSAASGAHDPTVSTETVEKVLEMSGYTRVWGGGHWQWPAGYNIEGTSGIDFPEGIRHGLDVESMLRYAVGQGIEQVRQAHEQTIKTTIEPVYHAMKAFAEQWDQYNTNNGWAIAGTIVFGLATMGLVSTVLKDTRYGRKE